MLHALDDVGATLVDGRVRSPFLDEMVRLVDAAWRVFPSANIGETRTCPCCLPEADRTRLAWLPREAWSVRDLDVFARSAHLHDASTAARTRYLLPRFLQITLTRGDDDPVLHDVPLHHVGSDRQAAPWPEAETAIIDGFQAACHAHVAVCRLAYDVLPDGAIPDGDFDEVSPGEALEDAVSTATDPVGVVRRTFAAAGHAGAYANAQMLTGEPTKRYARAERWWDPIYKAGVRDAPARVRRALTDEVATAAYERLAAAVPHTEDGAEVVGAASRALAIARQERGKQS